MGRKKNSRRGLISEVSGCVETVENAHNKIETSISDEGIDISDILAKKLKVFRVSPLNDFHSEKLKQYGFKLKEELNTKRNLNSSTIQFCKLNLNTKLRLNSDCAKTIEVEVVDILNRVIYIGYFISWAENKQIENYTSVPILLVSSKSHEIKKIHSAICKIFDCDIQPVSFSFYGMITFFVQLLENSNRSMNDSQEFLALEYNVPGCEAKDNIEVTFLLEDTRIILAVIADNLRKNNENIKYMEVILEFYNRILKHIYNVYKMDLMFAKLKKIVFPNAFITCEGQLKITTSEAATTVLNNLQGFTSLEVVLNG